MTAPRFAEILAAALLAAQGLGVLRMPFVEDRFFAWSPHDSRTDFRVVAFHQGRPVPDSAIRARYTLPPTDWHAAGDVKAVIATAESRLPAHQRWSVRLIYRVNLGPEQVWSYPAP